MLGGWLEPHLDDHFAGILELNLCMSCAIRPPKAQADGRLVAQVAPPELALRPEDRNDQPVRTLLIGDRKSVLSTCAPTNHCDERQAPAYEWVQARAKQ